MTEHTTRAEQSADAQRRREATLLAWPIGQKLHLLAGKEVPNWLHSFAGYVTAIGRKRYKMRIPVCDDRERWISASQVQLTDPWAR